MAFAAVAILVCCAVSAANAQNSTAVIATGGIAATIQSAAIPTAVAGSVAPAIAFSSNAQSLTGPVPSLTTSIVPTMQTTDRGAISTKASTPYVMIKLSPAVRTRLDEYRAPVWWKQLVSTPFDKNLCNHPAIALTFINGTRNVRFVRSIDNAAMNDSAEPCKIYPEFAWLLFVSDFYEAFYGTPQVYPLTVAFPVVLSQLAFFCIPLSLGTLALSLFVIRKLVRENNSANIFTYHLAIVVTDAAIYVVNALTGVKLLGILLLPLCYVGNMMFTFGYGRGYPDEANQTFMEGAYCLTCCIQAALALDRYFALYAPLKYHANVTSRTATTVVLVIVAINVVVGIMELISNFYFVRLFTNDFDTSTPLARAFYAVDQARIAIRTFLLNVGMLIQVFACTMVFIKMRQISRVSVAQRAKATSKGLASCYLLFGTCVLSFVGTALTTVRLILLSDPLLGSQRLSNDSINKIATTAQVWAKAVTPICSGCGFFVHCAASSQYRELLMKTRLGALLKVHVLARLGTSVAPETSAASSSAMDESSSSQEGSSQNTNSISVETTSSSGRHSTAAVSHA